MGNGWPPSVHQHQKLESRRWGLSACAWTYVQGWPEPYIYGVYSIHGIFGKEWPNIWSYTVHIYDLASPTYVPTSSALCCVLLWTEHQRLKQEGRRWDWYAHVLTCMDQFGHKQCAVLCLNVDTAPAPETGGQEVRLVCSCAHVHGPVWTQAVCCAVS